MFGLLSNPPRDLAMGFFASKSTNNPVRYVYDYLDSVISVLADSAPKAATSKLPGFLQSWVNNKAQLMRSYKAMGGGHSSNVSADRNLLAESKARIMPGYINPAKPLQATGRMLGKGVSVIERLNNAFETAPRLGEYKRFAKGGTYADRVRGLYEANDVTVNFQRSGEVSRFMDAFVPYFNAAIQGLDKFGRVFKDNPAQATMKALMVVTLPSMLLYAKNHNDPNYQKLNERDKDNNFLIPKGDGTFIKIPKPRELGAIFGALPERIMRAWKEDDPNAFDKFSSTLLTNFLPGLRTIYAPVGDIRANKDFAGRPIVPEYMKDLSPANQYDERTSTPGKAIGKALNVSPKQVDFLVKSYTGFVGALGIPAMTKGTSMKEVLQRQVIVDPVYSNKLTQDFYDKKKQLDTMYADTKQQGRTMADNDEKLRKLYNKISGTISDTRNQAREVEKNKLLDPEAKKGKLRGMQAAIGELAGIADKPVDEQLKLYNDLKRRGRIVEEKKQTPGQLRQQQANEQKKYKEMTGIMLR